MVTAAVAAVAIAGGVLVVYIRRHQMHKPAVAEGLLAEDESGMPLLLSNRNEDDADGDDDAAAVSVVQADVSPAPPGPATVERDSIVNALSQLLTDDPSASRWTTVVELVALLQRFRACCADMDAAGSADGVISGVSRVAGAEAAAEAPPAAAVAAAVALRTVLAEQKVLLQQAVDQTDLAQISFYCERVDLLRLAVGGIAHFDWLDGGGANALAHERDSAGPALECVAPGLLLRKVSFGDFLSMVSLFSVAFYLNCFLLFLCIFLINVFFHL